jgi:2'-5' RNA ligase
VSDDRVRLFVALSLPPAVRAALGEWRDAAAHQVGGLRPVASESLHVTLCFLGSQPADAVGAIADSCAVAGSAEVPRLTLAEPVWLPGRRPRVLGVSVADDRGVLAGVQAGLSAALSDGGWYSPESRPFFAHVTVARVAHGARVRPVELGKPPALEFEGAEVVLYRSRTSRSGARYEPLMRVAVGAGARRHDPLSVVRDFHRLQACAYADGVLEPLRELLRADVVWHVPGRSAIAGEHHGVDAVLAYFDRRRSMTGATFRITIHGVSLIGDRVVQFAGGTAMRDGEPVSWETVGVFRVADGQIAECWLVPFDLYAFDRIWT